MEQVKGKSHQQQNLPTSLRCPRCGSLNTKFRYFNNRSPMQPRYYCKTCKRQWTVGGQIRSIPFGSSIRKNKKTKASSSRCGSSGSQTPQPQIKREEEHLQDGQTLPTTATIQVQPVTNLPGVNYEHVDHRNELGSVGGNVATPEERSTQGVPSQQVMPQQIPTHNLSYNAPSCSLHNTSFVQPGLNENSLPQEIPNNFNSLTSDPSLCNIFFGNSTDPEDDTSSVNIDEWLNLSDHDTP